MGYISVNLSTYSLYKDNLSVYAYIDIESDTKLPLNPP